MRSLSRRLLGLLIVDDDPDHLRSCAALLQPYYQVATVTTPLDAIHRLGSERFDIVLSEQGLQPIHGTELMAIVRRRHEQTWRIIMSAAHETPEIRSAIDIGNVHRFLSKPVKPEHVVQAADRHCDVTMCAIFDRDATRAHALTRDLASLRVESSIVPPDGSFGEVNADIVLLVDPESIQKAQAIAISARSRRPNAHILVALPVSALVHVAAYRAAGADDFVLLPVRAEEVCLRHYARSLDRTSDPAARHIPGSGALPSFPNIVAGTDATQRVLEQVHQVAASDLSVLLAGETETGKEVIARAIHALSARRGLREILADIERRIIAETLKGLGGNQLATARKLAIPRQTLQHRLKKYGL